MIFSIKKSIAVLLLVLAASSVGYSQATYSVEFNATWSAETHPGEYPANAHFSPLVGTTHDSSVSLWEPGGIASNGIERMAETGATNSLQNEIRNAVGPGRAILGRAPGPDSPGFEALEFDVDADMSLITLVTMIAPSPDWFVGVSGFDLRPNDEWIDSVTIDLFGYDAGTDSGTDFTSADLDTNPAEPIAMLTDAFVGTPALGTYTFTLISVPEPTSVALLLAGLIGLLIRRRMR